LCAKKASQLGSIIYALNSHHKSFSVEILGATLLLLEFHVFSQTVAKELIMKELALNHVGLSEKMNPEKEP
jgi:hypothetical protein